METSNIVADKKTSVKWGQVVLYYLLACAISWPFFWWRDIMHWQGFQGPGFLKTTSIMWGPGLAGIICLLLFRKTHQRRITFFGSSKVFSILFWFAPFAALAVLGVNAEDGQVSHTLPLLISLMGALTVLGEEMGWRGFLQDALRPLKPVWRYALIGLMWELWHFTNRTHDRTAMQILVVLSVSIPVVILLSLLIGLAADRSNSVMVATALHGWVDLLFEFPGITTYICAGFSVLFWAFLLWAWPQTIDNSKSPQELESPGS